VSIVLLGANYTEFLGKLEIHRCNSTVEHKLGEELSAKLHISLGCTFNQDSPHQVRKKQCDMHDPVREACLVEQTPAGY
jgi:hypothetical protein